jgi:hypothetical protein
VHGREEGGDYHNSGDLHRQLFGAGILFAMADIRECQMGNGAGEERRNTEREQDSGTSL